MRNILASAALIAALPIFASAVSLPDGAAVSVPATTSAATPELAGGVVNDNLIAFSETFTNSIGTVTFSGNLQNRVAVSDVTGTLIFAPLLRDLAVDNSDFAFNVDSIELIGYAPTSIEVFARTDSAGTQLVTNATRNDPDGIDNDNGDVITLFYEPALTTESTFPNLLTSAVGFNFSGGAVVRGSLTSLGERIDFAINIDQLAVPTAIPLPMPALLLLTGLAGIAALRTRRV